MVNGDESRRKNSQKIYLFLNNSQKSSIFVEKEHSVGVSEVQVGLYEVEKIVIGI